jgi:hypothetical protein
MMFAKENKCPLSGDVFLINDLERSIQTSFQGFNGFKFREMLNHPGAPGGCFKFREMLNHPGAPGAGFKFREILHHSGA